MRYIDFHTHLTVFDKDTTGIRDGIESWGIHPWYINQRPATLPNDIGSYMAIGECGLDKICDTPFDLQTELFVQHIRWSEELHKPLIIHCVKAIDHILALHREMHPRQRWMVHGFRGKPQQLESLLAADIMVSFGFRHNVESLHLCPLENLLLESDETPLPISQLYATVATELQTDIHTLTHAMQQNYEGLFPHTPK